MTWQDILISRQIARDIKFLCGGIKEKSFVEETVIFTFPYQTNGNHATEPSTVGHVILTTALERYFRFDWNCKQLQVESEEQYAKLWDLFPNFLWNYTYKFENIFHSTVLGRVGKGYCKKNRELEFLPKFLSRLPQHL